MSINQLTLTRQLLHLKNDFEYLFETNIQFFFKSLFICLIFNFIIFRIF
jgi:hypothetical protein